MKYKVNTILNNNKDLIFINIIQIWLNYFVKMMNHTLFNNCIWTISILMILIKLLKTIRSMNCSKICKQPYMIRIYVLTIKNIDQNLFFLKQLLNILNNYRIILNNWLHFHKKIFIFIISWIKEIKIIIKDYKIVVFIMKVKLLIILELNLIQCKRLQFKVLHFRKPSLILVDFYLSIY